MCHNLFSKRLERGGLGKGSLPLRISKLYSKVYLVPWFRFRARVWGKSSIRTFRFEEVPLPLTPLTAQSPHGPASLNSSLFSGSSKTAWLVHHHSRPQGCEGPRARAGTPCQGRDPSSKTVGQGECKTCLVSTTFQRRQLPKEGFQNAGP